LRVPIAASPRALGAGLFITLAVFASSGSYASTVSIQASGLPLNLDRTAAATTASQVRAPVVAREEPPLTHDRLIQLVQETWPEDPDTAVRILICESHAADDDKTYDVDAANGGPMQLDRYTWAPYFEANYGWSWDQVVNDIPIHLQAARLVYDRAEGWGPWSCG
jgi:hypothetical protein